MERQANAIAPYIIMPTKTFTKNVKDIVTKYECYNYEDVVSHIEKIIEELAEYYGVTIYAARNRLIDIGYDEARGAFNWVDNHYVPPYLFRKGTLKKSESFSIDYKDIAMKIISNKDTRELICCNDLVFVENHVCINDKKYITKDDTGNLILTYYARMNMDECCIKFVYKEKGKNDENGYGAFCYLCRDANQGFNFEIDISLDKNGKLADKLDTIKRSEQYFKDIQANIHSVKKLNVENVEIIIGVMHKQLKENMAKHGCVLNTNSIRINVGKCILRKKQLRMRLLK